MKDLIDFYSEYSEDKRLSEKRSRALERTTTMEYIRKYTNSDSTVADIGAGPGVYAIDLAQYVKSVIAVDIVPKHTEELIEKCKQRNIKNIDCITSSATNLKNISDEKADLVLCLGPLYHIKDCDERFDVIKECKRILKPGGTAFFAYINKLTAIYYFTKNEKFINPELLQKIDCPSCVVPEGFDRFLDISYFTDPQEIENEILTNGLNLIANIGTDSVSYLIQDQLEKMPEEYWRSFVHLHLKHCEDKNSFGMSMHGLLIARK